MKQAVRILEIKKGVYAGLYNVKLQIIFDGGYFMRNIPWYDLGLVDELAVLNKLQECPNVIT